MSSGNLSRCVLRCRHRMHTMPPQLFPRRRQREKSIQLLAMPGRDIRREHGQHLHQGLRSMSCRYVLDGGFLLHVHHTSSVCRGTIAIASGCREERYGAIYWKVVIFEFRNVEHSIYPPLKRTGNYFLLSVFAFS